MSLERQREAVNASRVPCTCGEARVVLGKSDDSLSFKGQAPSEQDTASYVPWKDPHESAAERASLAPSSGSTP